MYVCMCVKKRRFFLPLRDVWCRRLVIMNACVQTLFQLFIQIQNKCKNKFRQSFKNKRLKTQTQSLFYSGCHCFKIIHTRFFGKWSLLFFFIKKKKQKKQRNKKSSIILAIKCVTSINNFFKTNDLRRQKRYMVFKQLFSDE